MLNLILTIIIAYFIGAIPFSFYVAKKMGNIDIREHGSMNAGATNVYRVLGAKAGVTALALDVAKGFLTVFLIQNLFGYELSLLAAIIVIIGHCYSYLLGFKGGKGIATGVGTVIALAPLTALILFGIFVLIMIATSYVSLGSITCAALLPFIAYFNGVPTSFFYFAVPVALLVILRHRANIGRLIRGEERKTLIFKKK